MFNYVTIYKLQVKVGRFILRVVF